MGSEEREGKKRDGKMGSKCGEVPQAYTVGGGEKYLVIE